MGSPSHKLDFDTKMAQDFLPRAMASIDPNEVKILKNSLQHLIEDMHSGLLLAPADGNLALVRAFPQFHMRFRFDFNIWRCWVVEKWCDEPFVAWVIILKHLDEKGKPILGLGPDSISKIIKDLQEAYVGDLTPQQLRDRNQNLQRKKAVDRDKYLTDRLLTRVDRLSERQCSQMRDALTALRTGDRITAHGPDEKFLERQYFETQKRFRDGTLYRTRKTQCINPHANPARKQI